MDQHSKPDNDPASDSEHLTEEADIGSGERSPGQRDTDEHIKSIPPLPHDSERGKPAPAKK